MTALFTPHFSPNSVWASVICRRWPALGVIALLTCAFSVTPATAAEPETKPATSILAFHYPPDPISKNRTEFPMILLADMPEKKKGKKKYSKTKSRLQLGRRVGLQTIEVPAGRYYVRQIKSDNLNFQRSPRPVPKSETKVVQIPPGAVAYLGDVSWDSDMGTMMSFSKEGLLELQAEATLHSQPLYLVAFGMEPRSVSWE